MVLLWNRTCHGLASPLPWVKGSSAGEEIGLLAEMMEEREAEGSGSEVKVVSCWEGEWLFSWSCMPVNGLSDVVSFNCVPASVICERA